MEGPPITVKDQEDPAPSSPTSQASGARPTPGPYSCFGCAAKKRLCDKHYPCGRCSRLGLVCVMQTRGRGRPPRHAGDTKPAPVHAFPSAPLSHAAALHFQHHHHNVQGDGHRPRTSPDQSPAPMMLPGPAQAVPRPMQQLLDDRRRETAWSVPHPVPPPTLHQLTAAYLNAINPAPPLLQAAGTHSPHEQHGSCGRAMGIRAATASSSPLDVLSSVASKLFTSPGAKPEVQLGTAAPPQQALALPPPAPAGEADGRPVLQVDRGAGEMSKPPPLDTWQREAARRQQEGPGPSQQQPPEVRVQLPLGGADPMELAFDGLCLGVARLRVADQLHVRRTKFIWQAIDFIFLLSGEVFAGPNYLRYLSESVQSLEWKAFAFLQQQDQSRRAASQPQEDEQLSPRRKRLRDSEQQDKAMQWAAQVAARVGPSATGLTDLYGKANNPTGEVMGPGTVKWVHELLETPGAAAVCFCLVRPDMHAEERVVCNEMMSRMFLSVDEMRDAALQQHTVIPTILASVLHPSCIQEFFASFAQCLSNRVEEASCQVEMRDRRGQMLHCLATMRWHYLFDRIVLACRFWPLQHLQAVSSAPLLSVLARSAAAKYGPDGQYIEQA